MESLTRYILPPRETKLIYGETLMTAAIRRWSSRFRAGYHGGGMLFWKKDMDGNISVFLGKRKHGVDKGRWSLPGGGWEYGDGLAADGSRNYHRTALRESREETGYEIPEQDDVTRIWSIHIPFFHFEVFDYRMRELNALFILDTDEFSEGKWFSITALPDSLEWFVPLQIHNLEKKLVRREKLKDVILVSTRF